MSFSKKVISFFSTPSSSTPVQTRTNTSKTSLISLPSEVIGSIADFTGYFWFGNIWCCGCRDLNTRIASSYCIRDVVVINHLTQYLNHLPRYVLRMRGLKSITLRSVGETRKFHIPWLKAALTELPHTLETISLGFNDSLSLWIDSETKPPFLTYFDFNKHLPQLSTLILNSENHQDYGHSYNSASLPPNTDFQSFIAHLPSSLTNLSITFSLHFNTKSYDLSTLPPTLVVLNLGIEKEINLNFAFKLPNLLILVLPFMSHGIFNLESPKPSSLTQLELPSCRSISSGPLLANDPPDDVANAFFQLMPDLTHVCYRLSGLEWLSMPFWRNISYFRIPDVAQKSTDTLNALIPPYASTLVLRGTKMKVPKLVWADCVLPSNLTSLTYFTCGELSLTAVRMLPDTLTYLAANWEMDEHVEIIQSLPPRLVHLQRFSYVPLGMPQLASFPTTLHRFSNDRELFLNIGKYGLMLDGSHWASLNTAAAKDDVDVFKLIMNRLDIDFSHVRTAMSLAVKRGKFGILEYLESQSEFWTSYCKIEAFTPLLMNTALDHRRLDSLDWLRARGFKFKPTLGLRRPIDQFRALLTTSFINGSKSLIPWLLSQGFKKVHWPTIVDHVFTTGEFGCFPELIESGIAFPPNFGDVVRDVVFLHTPNNLTNILEFLSARKLLPLNQQLVESIFRGLRPNKPPGWHLALCKWFKSQRLDVFVKFRNNMGETTDMLEFAKKNGDEDLAEWLASNRRPNKR